MASDHCPVVVKVVEDSPKGRRLFKFEAYWAKEAECREVVCRSWSQRSSGNILSSWGRKLKECRASLMRWSTKKFRERGHQIDVLTQQLDDLQMCWGPNFQAIKEKSKRLDELRAQEESFWLQRSRVRWLREGMLIRSSSIKQLSKGIEGIDW